MYGKHLLFGSSKMLFQDNDATSFSSLRRSSISNAPYEEARF
jgi:hypothetical protein